MKRVLSGLFKVTIFVASMWWIYSNCISWKEKVKDTTIEKIEEKILEEILQNQVLEMIPNDAEEDEKLPLPVRQTHGSNTSNSEGALNVEQKCLEELKEMLQGDKSSEDIQFEEDFLKSHIRSSKYNIDQAFTKIQNFLKLRKEHNYFFHNINFDFTQYKAYRFVNKLPRRRKDGSVTVVFKLGKWNPDEVPFEHMKQILFMVFVQELRNPVTQASGFNVIYDFEDAGLQYLKYGTRTNLRLLNHVALEVLPAKFVGIHMVNMNFIGRLLLTVMRPFMPQFIIDVLHVHATVEELSEFFPPSMLPVEYGGTLTDYYFGDWMRRANEQHGDLPPGGQKNEL